VKITWHWKVSFGGPPLPAYAYTILSEPFIVGVPTEWPSAPASGWKVADEPLGRACIASGIFGVCITKNWKVWITENWKDTDEERVGYSCIRVAESIGKWPGGDL
jgi:hypothetical protein